MSLIKLEDQSEFASSKPIVKCKDGKWRDSAAMLKDQCFPECELCGDEVRRLRGQTSLIKAAGSNPTAIEPAYADKKTKYRVFCCVECSALALEKKDRDISHSRAESFKDPMFDR